MKLNFELGDQLSPQGRAFIYWEIITIEDKQEIIRFVVANFIVSPIPFENKSVVATFPPILYNNKKEFSDLARKGNLDLIKMGAMKISADFFNFQDFFKKQMKLFNQLIKDYSGYYQAFLQEDKEIKILNEKESINLISKLSNKIIKTADRTIINKILREIRKIGNQINTPHIKYDIEDFLFILDKEENHIEEIAKLYIEKFRAIYYEEYEDAEKYKQDIKAFLRKD